MTIDWSKAPANAEAASGLSLDRVWYRRDLYGRVFQICPSAGIEDWTSMGGRTDFPVGSVLRPIEQLGATVQRADGWNGDGLPPVGMVCELRAHKLTEWSAAKIEFAYRNVIVWDWIGEPSMNGLCTAYCDNVEFRPIRTAEQIAAEERKAQRSQLAYVIAGYDGYDSPRDRDLKLADYLLDSGYGKQENPCGS